MTAPYPSEDMHSNDTDASALRGLTSFIEEELDDMRYYRMLSERAPSEDARAALAEIANDEERHAKNLMASYFLTNGRRYVAESSYPKVHIPFYPSALRERFREELKGAHNYNTAADESDDEQLAQLYRRHAEDENEHANLLRTLLSHTM